MIEKMLTKVLIFGLLCNIICRGFSQVLIQTEAPTDGKLKAIPKKSTEYKVVAEGEERACEPKIISYKEKIPLLKNMLHNFTELAEKHKLYPADKILIENERDHVRTMTDDFIAKFDPDLEKLRNMAGPRARMDWCAHEMSIYLKMRRNLTLAGKQFKEDVLSILNHTSRFLPTSTTGTAVPHYPEYVRDDFDEVLSEIVNWLFIVDMGTNIMRSTGQLLKKLYDTLRTKMNLEKLWTITKGGKVEVPEKVDIMYHDDEIKDKGFDEQMSREENEVHDNSVDAAEEGAAERTGVLEEAGETGAAEAAEGVEVAKGAQAAKDETFLEEVIEIFEAVGARRVRK